ncbi:hypothetical protein EGI22_06970 [Lacihabitans sp. LS3-19]|uniref:LamG-like jellyroll fold domain-containing protein n=1 Tax=Lacihabitans sp. LS3-19 TaxID=2487335 RepID=UPI0020CE7B65|nr:LamG-like jellyroll fold domain-containing protein [Lacihabitans sp. LS3-19]MCP9767649.1 hypothetical protein [Lacihabitans sp. LS3-19]
MKPQFYLSIIILLFISNITFASHFRGGKIEWTRSPNSNTVTFKVYSVWREDFVEDISLDFGDGQYSNYLIGNEILHIDGYRVIESAIDHTYASTGNYSVNYSSCCRIDITQNSPGYDFSVSTTVCLNSSNLNSPSSNSPFIIELTQGNLNQLQLSGFDNDGASVNFSTSVISGYSFVPSSAGNILTISPSGVLNWNTSGTTIGQLWQLKYKISDGCAETEMDILVKIVQSTCPVPLGIIAGNNVIQSGQSSNITLSFTGAAPWTYEITDIGSGTTSTNPFVVAVSPSQTTTYVINSISNSCGFGNTIGSAKVVVCNSSNVATSSITGTSIIGSGQSTNLTLDFTGNGPWNYTVSNFGSGVSSSNQKIISVSPTQNTTYTITNLSDACGTGLASPNSAVVSICPSPSAVISGSTAITSGGIANIYVNFTGTPPWAYNISNFGTGSTSNNPLTIGVNPSITTTYALVSVSNSCSSGTTSGSATITVCPASNTVTLNNNLPIVEGASTNLVLNSSVIPFNYNISGIGNGVANTSPFNIQVSPLTTTKYELLSATNSCGTPTFSGISTVVVQAPNSNKKLISCFPFDGNVIDQKGTNTSYNSGAVLTSDRFGNPNSAYYFDGYSNISLSTNELINNEFTYSAWVKPTSLPLTGEIQILFSIGGSGGDQLFSINNSYFGDTENRPKFNMPNYIGYNSAGPYLLSDEIITENNWYFVTFVRSIDSLLVYINGEKSNSVYSTGVPPYYAGNIAMIGSRYFGGQGFKGTIDDLKLFKGVLTKEEIKILYLTQTCNFEYLENHKVELISCYNFSGNSLDGLEKNNAQPNNVTYSFDRFGNSNSSVILNGTGDLSLNANNFALNNYSISLWTKLNTTNNNTTLFLAGQNSTNQIIRFVNDASSGNIPSFKFEANLISGLTSISAPNILTNQWYHIVAIKDPSRIRLYINGNLIGEKGIYNNSESYYGIAPINATFGSKNGTEKLNGLLDDIKIYNGSLYEAEVKEIYQKTISDCNFSPCPTYLNVTGNILGNENLRASVFLEGSNINTNNSNFSYFSGKSILIKPGFNSNSNIVFKAEIKGCYN